jgi:curved DNA-binding protein
LNTHETDLLLFIILVLGVNVTAQKQTIRNAYLHLAKKYHPDTNKEDVSKVEKFKRITKAYEILSDENTRKLYDLKELTHIGGVPHHHRFKQKSAEPGHVTEEFEDHERLMKLRSKIVKRSFLVFLAGYVLYLCLWKNSTQKTTTTTSNDN